MQIETKKFKNPPEVRAVLAQVRREQRAKNKKAMEAQVHGPTSTAPSNPTLTEGKPK
jgi:hypothetical protein